MTLTTIIDMFIGLGMKIIPLLGLIAFLLFVLGVGKFIRASGEKDMKDSKNIIIWSIVGLFILTTIWGIVVFLQREFGITDAFGIPQIKL